MASVHLQIRGLKPVGYSCSGEEAWREFVAAKGREQATRLVSTPDDPRSVSKNPRFHVKAAFYFVESNVLTYDLDNLSKCVLDSLFTPPPNRRARFASGGLFPVDDNLVYELDLSKETVPRGVEEGVEIWASW